MPFYEMSVIKPPQGFTALGWAVNTINKPYDVIGVCVDYFEPAKTKGSDYTIQFVLHDPSWHQDRGMKYRFFHSSLDQLPTIKGNGDVLILRNVMTKAYNSQPIGMSNSTTSWVVLSGSTILESNCPHGSDISFLTSSKGNGRAPSPTVEELKYARDIVNLENPMNYRPPPRATALQVDNIIKDAGGIPPQRKEKWLPIQDLRPESRVGGHKFADLLGEVRKSWYSDYGRVELSLTDYTSNKLLYSYSEESRPRDGDAYGYSGALHDRWLGPWGRMTIGVTLFDAHAVFAKSSVKPGMYVLIKNCVIGLDPKGSKLEAKCRGDRDDMSKVNVSILQPHQAEYDPRFGSLLKRKLEYEKMAKAKGLRFEFDPVAQQETKKRTPDHVQRKEAENEINSERPKKPSRQERRRQRKAAKHNTEGPMATNLESPATNQYVRCNNIAIPLKPIDDILDPAILNRKTAKGNDFTLPFQNCSYKCKVRVVDYWPTNLADFSVPYLVTDHDALPDAGTPEDTNLALTAAQSNPHTVRWQWRFFLVVEDVGPDPLNQQMPRQQLALLVADQDGEYLLNDEASDLRANPQELAKLKEKLFVLWGDLQERKEEAVATGGEPVAVTAQSKPFECFINEYGVSQPGQGDKEGLDTGYQRMFRLFGTSI